MKRYLIPILIVSVLALSVIGCAQSHKPTPALKEDKPSWSEAQVIDYLYAYLVDKAEQVGGIEAELGEFRISENFRQVVVDANLETIRESTTWPPSEEVSLKFFSLPVYVDSTKRLASYTEDSWWMVTIRDWQWLVNERTGEIKAENEAAKQLLRDITRNSYYDLIHNYAIAYPSGWKVVRFGEDKVAFFEFESSELTCINIAAKVYKLKAGESLGEYASLIASFTGLSDLLAKDYQLNSLIRLENGDYQADYEYKAEGIQIWGREYFKLHNGWVYMISYRTPKSMYEYWLPEFNYSYESFCFRQITEWDNPSG